MLAVGGRQSVISAPLNDRLRRSLSGVETSIRGGRLRAADAY